MKTFRFLFIALAVMLCINASAHDFEVDGIYYNITSSSELTVSVTYRGSNYDSYFNEYNGSVVIPEKVTYDSKEYSVTSIGDLAFRNCYGLLSVTIPNSVTSIGNYAFQGCSDLNSVTIPNSVTIIGDRAFQNCSSLTSVTIPNSVTSIRNYAFHGCSGLNSVTIPNSVTSIGRSAFEGCSGELTVNCNIPSASSSEYGVFYGSKFTSVIIGDKVTSIGQYAFYGCSGLTAVHITDLSAWCKIKFDNGSSNPTCYAHHLYLNGEEITNLVIPDDVTSIGNYAFYDCSGLTSVTIPNSVTSIGRYAFYGCSGLMSFSIPNSVTSIGSDAFTCTGWYNYPPFSVVLYIDSWLIGCKGKVYGALKIKEGTKRIQDDAFYDCSDLTSVDIPNSVTIIGDRAFQNCSSLTSVTIPNSVTSIGGSAFDYCSGLTAVHITDLSAWCKIKFDNGSSNPTYYAHHLYLNGEEITNLVIPDDVTSIGNYAFYGCSGLTSVDIPNSVTSIGEKAFDGCSGLTSVTIGNSVTSIGQDAFYGCSGLTSVTIGNSVTSIGNYAFYGCSGLTSVTIPNSVTSIGESAFQYCSGLTSVTIPNSVTSIGYSAFRGCSGLTSVTIPNSVTSIENYAFYGCSGLTSVTIPNSVTSIGSMAFYKCSALTSVTIPNSVTSIGSRAFQGCSSLTSVDIPNSITKIENHTFNGCTGLLSISIPNSVTDIGSSAFYSCSGLASVTIGNSVTSIGSTVFEGCSGLKSMRIEDGEASLIYYGNFSNTIDSLYIGRNIAVKSSYFNTGENKLSVLSIGKYVVSLDDKMFNECKNIAKIISYATEPPVAYPMTFTTDIYGKATLSVLGESMEKYRNADVWKKFSKIEEIDNNPDATEQCAAPVITYADGKLQFACETAGAECKYTLTAKDIQTVFITVSNNSVDLTACYDITAYAVAEGYKNSEKVIATLYWINGSDVSTNINQTEMRGVMATCSGGIITVSGLTDGETVMFYDANGALLYTGTAQNGTISYAPSASGVIIVKIGTTSIKVVS